MKLKSKSAFTLVEILVVVLIIGILTAVAIPMYQSAVDKTHWSTLLPTARALKNAEEAYLMATNVYTDNADALDVAATEGDATYELQMPDPAARYVIRATSDKLPNVRLAQYLDENAAMAGQLHCEAKTGDERATKLCNKLLNGQELITTDDGYISYLLDQEVDRATCNNIGRVWSSTKASCYSTEQAKCKALGKTWLTNLSGWHGESYADVCGYSATSGQTVEDGLTCITLGHNGCLNTVINEGGTCYAPHATNGSWGCGGSTINSGGICVGNQSMACQNSTVNDGGKCIANGDYGCRFAVINSGAICEGNYAHGCDAVTVKEGGKCIASARSACTGTYSGGCCQEGIPGETYCPTYAPKC